MSGITLLVCISGVWTGTNLSPFFLFFFLSFFLSFYLSFSLSFFLSFFLSLSLSLSFFLSFYLSFFLSIYLSFFLSFYLSFFLSFFLSVSLSFFLSLILSFSFLFSFSVRVILNWKCKQSSVRNYVHVRHKIWNKNRSFIFDPKRVKPVEPISFACSLLKVWKYFYTTLRCDSGSRIPTCMTKI